MSSSLIKISAIVTTYNSEKTIQRVVRSILNQEGVNSRFDIEIIVVDDCSKDRTPEILKELNVQYYSTVINSGGPNKGRNIGLGKATGQFICIVDHDDEWHSNRIGQVLPYLGKAAIITSGYILADSSNRKTTIRGCRAAEGEQAKFFDVDVTFKHKLRLSRKAQNTYLGSIIYSAALKNVRFEETSGMIDYDWLLRLFHGQNSLEICEPLYTRYVEGKNLSLDENYRLNNYALSLQTVSGYLMQYPKEVKESVKRINGSLARYYYLVGEMQKARKYFLKAGYSPVILFYLLTTYAGSGFVKRNFKVFG